MFAFPVWEFLLELLWAFAVWAIVLFLFWGFAELYSCIFE